MRTMISLVILIAWMTLLSITQASVINIPGDYPTIQAGIDASTDGDTILIADGIYTGNGNFNIDFNGKAIEVTSANGPDSCVIDCQEMGRGFIFHSGETNTSIVRGLTVTGGSTDNYGGGAIYCDSSSPIIENCRFIGNQSAGYGGAIRYLDFGTGNWEMLTIVDCLFENNHSVGGGGIAIDGSLNSMILRCRLIFNSSSAKGGGISIAASTTYISDTEVSENSTEGEGGGIYYQHGFYDITNCLITDNAANHGGAFSGDDGLNILNCTVLGNSAVDTGGAFLITGVEPQIRNCVIRTNGAQAYVGFQDFNNTSYSNIENIPPFSNECIDEDPLFVNGPSGSFYLSQIAAEQTVDSPCLNTGSDDSASICFTELSGNVCLDTLTTRTDYVTDQGIVDMGYHYSTESPVPTPTPGPECETLGCDLEIPSGTFSPGDEFFCNALICNPTENTFVDVPLFTVIDVYAELYVLPGMTIDAPPGLSTHTVIPPFTWPENSGEGQAAIYSAMTNETVSEIFGVVGGVQFDWSD